MDGNTSTYEDTGATTRGKKSTSRKSSSATDATKPLETMSRDAGSAATDSGSGGDGIVEQAQQKVGEVAGQVQDKAGEVVDQVKQQATSRIDQQKDQATASLWSFANAIRDTGETLRNKDQGAVAQVTDRAAEQVERLSSYLAHRDVGQIMTEVQHFARRQPALFLGGAFALGLIGSRFLKSSSQPQTNDWDKDTDYSGQAYSVGTDDGYDAYGQSSGVSSGTGADAADWLDRGAESSMGTGADTGGWSGTGSSGGYDASGGGYGTTGTDYSGGSSAPPIRGIDPRVSGDTGGGGYTSQGYDVAGGTGGYGQGYDQGYGTGSGSDYGTGSADQGSGSDGSASPYTGNTEA